MLTVLRAREPLDAQIQRHIDNTLAASKEKVVVSIQDRTKRASMRFIDQVDTIIDEFVDNGFVHEGDDIYTWLKRQEQEGIKGNHVKHLATYFREQLQELLEAYEGDDEDLAEAYDCYDDDQHLALIGFYADIISDADKFYENKKRNRKPRKRKTLTADKQLARFKYLKEFPEFQLESIDPEQIIGATQLWVYNTKYRTVGVYHTDVHGGFKVKGCTIQGYDPKRSIQKKLRKPEDVLSRVLSGGKIILKKIHTEVNCKETKLNGRINNNIVLLRAL